MNRLSLITLLIFLAALVLSSGCNEYLNGRTNQGTAITCGTSQILVNDRCCDDLDNDQLCDETETINIGTGTTGGPVANDYTTSTNPNTQCRDIMWYTPPSNPKPSFDWVLPMSNEGVKGYWVRIDSGAWQLVDPPASNTAWTSPDALADGTHSFEVKAEYSTGIYGMPASTYFNIQAFLPDFVVTQINAGSPTSESYGSVTLYYVTSLSAVIKNQGGAYKKTTQSGSQSLKSLSYYVDGKKNESPVTAWVDELGAGEELELQFKIYSKGQSPTNVYLGTTPGAHNIKIIVNEFKDVEEADYTNNENSITVTAQ